MLEKKRRSFRSQDETWMEKIICSVTNPIGILERSNKQITEELEAIISSVRRDKTYHRRNLHLWNLRFARLRYFQDGLTGRLWRMLIKRLRKGRLKSGSGDQERLQETIIRTISTQVLQRQSCLVDNWRIMEDTLENYWNSERLI